jgi:hypothetical protein
MENTSLLCPAGEWGAKKIHYTSSVDTKHDICVVCMTQLHRKASILCCTTQKSCFV